MTRNLRSQRHPHYDDFICTVVSAFLLLSSLFVLNSHYRDLFPSHNDTTGREDTIGALYMVEEQKMHESNYFFDNVEWDEVISAEEDRAKTAFGYDDMPVDEWVRMKLMEVKCIEDALLLRGSLREGWGDWFDMKSDFLRKDKMLRSNLETLNPLNNPLLQDPDTPGLTVLTKGDKLWQMSMLNEFKKIPFPLKNII